MPLLPELLAAITANRVEIVDLTAPLSAETPILQLPPPFANTIPFSLEQISRYDAAGPNWYWNNIHTGEHTGTHVDAPVHWSTGKNGLDVAQLALRTLVAPAVVVDVSDRVAADPDHLLQTDDVKLWETRHDPLPTGGWLLLRTGWDSRARAARRFLNADETGPHAPGISTACARWLAEETGIVGLGGDRRHRRGRRARLRAALPVPPLLPRSREDGADPAAEPRRAAGDGRC